ncbi:MAG: tripartite tricarboxylate transporter substrate-binding protein [Burkholderiales bacterium]
MNTSMQSRRRFLGGNLALAFAAGLGASGAGRAAEPSAALRIVCVGPAGSTPDIVARRFGQSLASHFPGGVVVDNRPGAGGQIAINALKQSPHDGATVLLAQGAVATVYPYLYPKLAYDPIADLMPVSLAAEMTLGLAVGPAVPNSVTSLPKLVEWMRANPGAANYGSPGTGTLPHLLAAMWFREAGIDAQHVVYAGGPPALVDLMGGRIAVLVLPEGLLRQHQAAGRLRVLATSGATRTGYLPDVATFAEQGFKAQVVLEWFAFFMSGRSSAAVIENLSSDIRQAVAEPQFDSAFADSGMVAAARTPAALAQRIAQEQRYWEGVLRATGIRAG